MLAARSAIAAAAVTPAFASARSAPAIAVLRAATSPAEPGIAARKSRLSVGFHSSSVFRRIGGRFGPPMLFVRHHEPLLRTGPASGLFSGPVRFLIRAAFAAVPWLASILLVGNALRAWSSRSVAYYEHFGFLLSHCDALRAGRHSNCSRQQEPAQPRRPHRCSPCQ